MDRLVSVVRVEGMDKKEKNEYYKNMRNAFDIKSEKWFAREDGIKIGLAEGEARGLAKGREEVAKELKARGMSLKEISEITSMPQEAIAAL